MKPSWWMKPSHRQKARIRKTRVRWDLLGLKDPAETSCTTSIEDIRRQIISAANHGLGPGTLARAQTKGASRKSVPKVR